MKATGGENKERKEKKKDTPSLKMDGGECPGETKEPGTKKKARALRSNGPGSGVRGIKKRGRSRSKEIKLSKEG